MSVRTETQDGVRVVSFCGCLLCDSGSLEETLRRLAAEGAPVLLDLGEVEHLNSRTIGLLVAIHQATAKHGGSFSICNLNAKGTKLLQSLKLVTVLKLFATLDEALHTLSMEALGSPRRAGAGSRGIA